MKRRCVAGTDGCVRCRGRGLRSVCFASLCGDLRYARSGGSNFESIPISQSHGGGGFRPHQGNLFSLSLLLQGVARSMRRGVWPTLARYRFAAYWCGGNYLLYELLGSVHRPPKISNEHFRIGMRFTAPDEVAKRPRDAAEKIRVG